MENNFLHFNEEDTFQNQKEEIKDASISFIKDSGKIYTHGKEYNSVNWGEIKMENGVYVYTNTGQLVKPDDWDTSNNDNALGVAVVDDNCRFIISKSLPMMNDIVWSGTDTDISGLPNINSSSSAQNDFDGQSNTNTIISSIGSSTNYMVGYCRSQSLNGQSGYLPSSGELYVMWENKSDINSALQKIGANTIDTALDNLYSAADHYLWSSTESSPKTAWYLGWERSSSPLFAYVSKTSTGAFNYAFPFFPLNI